MIARFLCIAFLFAACGSSIVSAIGRPGRPKLQIINGSDQAADIFWLKSAKERIHNGSVKPGEDTVITTTLGHRFAIVGKKDGSTVEVESRALVQAFRFLDDAVPSPSIPHGRVIAPPAGLGVPGFYRKFISAHGYPIVASEKVSDFALLEAAWLADLMLAKRPDVREAMIRSGSRLCILAHSEFTTDQPEFAWLGKEERTDFPGMSGKDYIDARARGLGGSLTDPFCSCAEENLLGYEGDPYSTECILIHEFAHNIHLRGMTNVDPGFDERVKAAYDAAMKAGLWKGKYPSVNHHEYFAEGVQSWFDNNRENDHDHNHVNTRQELAAYDPGLAALCREVFGDTELRYTKPATRLSGHLAGYDPSKAPVFRWPERLRKAKDKIKAAAVARDQKANGITGYEPREFAGWQVKVSRKLLQSDGAAVERAVALLKSMLDDIVRAVPAAAVAELREVPLWMSPPYEGFGQKAEYHPDAGWLREHGRDPAMAKCVEFTNIAIFDKEVKRMPNFALHELAHAYHDRVLGHEHPGIIAAFEKAKAAGSYNRVQRRDGEGRRRLDRAYAMTNEKEYFAECSEAFFFRNDFFPFDREELRKHDPAVFAVLEKAWAGPPEKAGQRP